MTAAAKPSRRRRFRRVLSLTAGALLAGVAVLGLLILTGAADRLMRRSIVHRLEAMTGGRVELERFHFEWRRLRTALSGLTIHGREPAGTPPLFHADRLEVELRVDSFWGRRISLDEVILTRPSVHVRVNPDGSTNFPAPKRASPPGAPLRERLFDLRIRRLRLEQGELLYNDVRVPLAAEGGEFAFSLDAGMAGGKPIYMGTARWREMTLVARRYLPFSSDWSLKFTLEPDSFTAEQFVWSLPHSQLDVQAQLPSFARPAWSFRYRGRLNLLDVREVLRKPMTPAGQVDFSGEGSFAAGQVRATGNYSAHDAAMDYEWFHAGGLSSRGSYRADNRGVEVPDLTAQAVGGSVEGRVSAAFPGLQFRAETRAHGLSLAGILAAADHRDFPVRALNWDARVSADTLTTWTADFKHVEAKGSSVWSLPGENSAAIPVSARWVYDFRQDTRELLLESSEIHTPTSRVEVSGRLGKSDSALEVFFETRDLAPWNHFIEAVRGHSGPDHPWEHVAGHASWRGRIVGRMESPTFIGHVRGDQVQYGRLTWDLVEGDLTYSPSEFTIARGRARRGATETDLDLSLDLSRWDFLPGNHWSLDASLLRAPVADLQDFFGWSYPVRGFLTGQFHGRGTRAAPELTGLFDLAEGEGWGMPFDRFRGQVVLRPDELRVSNAELRALPRGSNGARSAGIITGSVEYRIAEAEIAFELSGAGLPLEGFRAIQTPRLPVGGQLSFQISGQGPVRAPVATGKMRLVDFRVGKEVIGSFEARLHSDGRELRFEVASAMPAGKVEGTAVVGLSGDFPLEGEFAVERMDLDPFLQAALRLGELSGHSSVDGRFQVRGALARPESIAVDASLSRLAFDYENVKLENSGPIRFHTSRDELRIEEASLHGSDTDFHIAGSVHFTGSRALSLSLGGTLNLRLATGFIPELDARGPARINASFEGTLDRPRITGKLRLENASARYDEFPSGLSGVTGDFVFDATRLLFENITAETGGGKLILSGSVNYAEQPLRYDVTARTDRVRIRYPEGMSWLAGASLRLSGTAQAGLLSGRVTVEKLVMSQGFDVAAMIVASKEGVSAPTTNSPFLRNLQFDIEAVSAADARLQWPGAQFETEANLRVRGTWEHPILLGHIHLLSGGMSFRGNRYRLARGEINFSNPFRLDPVLNVEAATTIRQYEVTLDFTGPASRLTLAYRSDPPLPANDIITLLALGRTGEETELRSGAAAQGTSSGASTLLSEAISSQIGGRLERLFGITRFRVDPILAGTTSGSEQNAAARVTVEQQIARDLTITYISNVTSSQQQVIQVEYNVNRNVSIIALRDQNGTFGLDVKFKKRFK